MPKLQIQTRSTKTTFKLIAFLFLILCGLGLIIYSASFNGEFVFDDLEFVLNNNYITDYSRISNFWEREAFPRTRLLPIYSFALNYQINQLNVFGYHVFNFIIHIITTIFVWWFSYLIFSLPVFKNEEFSKHKHAISFISALLFLSHPIQTQAVTYITQRFASMATLFYMGSMCFYLKGRMLKNRPRLPIVFYLLSAFFAICAMLSKEISITIPFNMLFVEYFLINIPKSGISVKDPKSLSSFLIPIKIFVLPIAAFIAGFTFLFRNTIFGLLSIVLKSESHTGEIITFGKYILTQPRVFVKYLRLLFLPIYQNLDYDFQLSKSIFEFSTFSSFIILICLLIFALKIRNKYRLASFGIFWFFITLWANLVPRSNLIFEHKLYLVSVGFCIALSFCIFNFFKNPKTSLTASMVIVIIFSFMTFKRNEVWKTEISLCKDVVSKSPNKLRPNQNMGSAYTKKGYYDEALVYLSKSLSIDPKDVKSYTNRGAVYYHKRQFQLALNDLNKAVEIDPEYFGSYVNRGLVFQEIGKHQLAFNDFTKALQIKPNLRLGYVSRGNLLNLTGHYDYAIQDFNQAISISPHYDDAYNGRGVTYFKLNRHQEALADFNKAITINPYSSKAYLNRGYFYFLRNNDDQSLSDLNRSIELNDSYAMAYNNRGILFRKMKMYNEAIKDFNKSIDLDPNQANAFNNRATVYYMQNKYSLALSDYNQALKNNPGYDRTYNNRGVLFVAAKQYENAISDFTQAIKLNSADLNAYLNRAAVYYYTKEYSSSVNDYSHIINNNLNNVIALFNRGVASYSNGDYTNAALDFDKAIELKGDFAKAFWMRSNTYKYLGLMQKAEKDLDTSKSLGIKIEEQKIDIIH